MNNKQISKEEKKLLNKVFWRSFLIYGSYNPMRASGIGFLYAIMPFINKYYIKEDERIKAMQRNAEYYNITSAISTFPMGIIASMEKENSATGKFDSYSINAIKASLMGPLSGIGDSFFWGTFRVIAAGIGIGLAEQGSILGPLLFLLLYNIPAIAARYYGTFLGYGLGEKYIKEAYEKGIISTLTKAAGILGITMVGAMIYTTIGLQTGLKFNLSGMEYNLQDILDQVLKGILPLSATMICFFFVRKKVSASKIMLGIIVVGAALSLIGLL
ncbi:PTS system mannose/fructose/sorbose family transporter subunit IID [Vagococcus elongatus]|uniref:PTS mannose transporter subunit IID n=1 Tax=Vagococcus elongatus TaxID=180344 RepID=A0A430AT65_9ENTE|nr:PTS system mannose/fructose/sorbose family transporter subunit IID [Vagococcus elongatus]RSU11254.1 PTS mannose transporter subunit IID [Vagococcus elongatus]